MTTIRQTTCMWILLAGTFLMLGCGGSDAPPLGEVSGTVELNGEPLAGVIVLFKPDNGRVATATTDSKGYYSLEYAYGVKGAKVGPNTVSLEWPLGFAGAKPLPAKYTTQSELKKEVEAGKNTIDLELTADGPAGPAPPKNVD